MEIMKKITGLDTVHINGVIYTIIAEIYDSSKEILYSFWLSLGMRQNGLQKWHTDKQSWLDTSLNNNMKLRYGTMKVFTVNFFFHILKGKT